MADSWAGRHFGPYQIEREIGRGGMAVVYKAYDPRHGRHVALKVLPAYFQHDPDFLARFDREAAAMRTLRHPNIVRVYDSGHVGNHHYLAMEYADGGSLADELARRAPLDLGRALDIACQVAGALDYAHDRRLVHRDLKPSNVLLTRDGRVLLSDFGIAKVMGQTSLTGPGHLVGTPAYMAPEQAQGQRSIDRRVDVYALGILLYEMLTGGPPFGGDTPIVVLHAVIYDPPPRPRLANPALPQSVEGIILQAIEKDPARRFQRAGHLATALRALSPGRAAYAPASARPSVPSARPPTPPPVARSTALGLLLPIAGGVVALGIVLTALFASMRPGPPTPTLVPLATTSVAVVNSPAAPSNTAEATPLPTETVEYYTSTPPPDEQPTATRVSTGETPDRIPTSTIAPSDNPAPTATWTPTATRRPKATATRPTSTATRQAYPRPVPEAPDNGITIGSQETVQLRWYWEGKLGQDEHFDVRVWREGQPHLGIAWVKETSYPLHIASLPARLGEPDQGGIYYWAIAVVRGSGGVLERNLSDESEAWSFAWEAPLPQPVETTKPPEDPCADCDCDTMCRRGVCHPCCAECCGGCK